MSVAPQYVNCPKTTVHPYPKSLITYSKSKLQPNLGSSENSSLAYIKTIKVTAKSYNCDTKP